MSLEKLNLDIKFDLSDPLIIINKQLISRNKKKPKVLSPIILPKFSELQSQKEEMEIAQGTILQITISIGVAFYPLDSNNFWEVARLADKALYNAKETGRNRVSCLKSAAKEHSEIDMHATINSDTAKSLPEVENFDSNPS